MTTQEQIEKIKRECLILTDMIPYVKIKLEYNRNKKIPDSGKICIYQNISWST